MTPRAQRWLQGTVLALVGAAAVVAAVAWFLHTHERVEEQEPEPASGEVLWNPLYALRQSLVADGQRAVSRQRLQPGLFAGAPGDTVLLDIDPARMRGDEVDALLDWVDRGGHLLVRTPPPGPVDGDEDDAAAASAVPPLLHRLGVEALAAPQCVHLQVEAGDPHVELCEGLRLRLGDVRPRLAWGDAEAGHAFVRIDHGRGTVDLLADFDFLQNPQLDEATHQALARQLLAPNYGRGTVHLVHATYLPSLWWRLARHGWPLWLPLALLLAGALWRRAQRFGPWLPSPAGARRSLREHVRASGALLHRLGQAPLLYEAVREAFLARLRRRDPATAALAGEARVQALAERMQLPHYLVRDALSRNGVQDRQTYLARVRTLIQMRNRL